MKRIILCIFGVVSAAICVAADTSWNFLRGIKAIDVEIDYHQAILNNMDEAEFVRYYSQYIQQEAWYPNAQKQWEKAFLREFADETLEKDCLVGDLPAAKIKLLITLLSSTDAGDITTTITFVDKETNTTLKVMNVNSKGGRMGGTINLIGDGFEHLGEYLGEIVRKQL